MFRITFLYLIALSIWVAVFWSDVPVLLAEWGHDDYSHCFLVLPIVCYILWTDRNKIIRVAGGGLWQGAVFVLVALAAFFVGRLGSLKTFVFLSMWLSLCGMGLLALGGRSLKVLWFPILIGLFSIPLPAFITRITSLKLRLVSSVLAEKMLQIAQVPVYREGNLIDLGVIQLQVVDACSGLRYLWPSLLMALLIGWLFVRGPWRRIVLVIVAIPVTILSNAFRIALTGILTKFIDPALAEGFFHDFSGWLVYVVSLCVLGGCAWIMRGKADEGSTRTPTRQHGGGRALAPWWHGVIPVGCLAVMLLGQLSLFHEQAPPDRVHFHTFPSEVSGWTAQRQTLSGAVLEGLGVDDYYNAVFRNAGTGDVAYVLVSWYDRQTTNHAAHAPTSCLVGSGWDIKSKGVLSPSAASGRAFPVTRMVLFRNKQMLLSNFFLLQRGKVVVSEWMNKWYLLKDAVLKQRTDGALVRVEMPVRPGVALAEAQETLDKFVGELRAALSPYLPADYSEKGQ